MQLLGENAPLLRINAKTSMDELQSAFQKIGLEPKRPALLGTVSKLAKGATNKFPTEQGAFLSRNHVYGIVKYVDSADPRGRMYVHSSEITTHLSELTPQRNAFKPMGCQ